MNEYLFSLINEENIASKLDASFDEQRRENIHHARVQHSLRAFHSLVDFVE